MEMFRRTFAEINLDHLAHNIGVLQKAFPQTFLCPMVKANAYGHGDGKLALFLESLGIQHLGVCLIEEGLLLRRMGVTAEILVFRGFDREGAEAIVRNHLTPVVSTWDQLDHLEAVAITPVSVHLKFDTGMNRLGFRAEEAQKLFDRLWQNKKIRLKALLTHLFNGEDATSDQGFSAKQLKQLDQISQLFKPFQVFCHALNSAGILSLLSLSRGAVPQNHPLVLQKWGLRPGLMIYGYNPLNDKSVCELKPVMTLKSHVGTYRIVKAGETVSYGGTWMAKRDSVIGVLPIGYADGYHRVLSNKSSVLFAGQRVPVVGTVCMDYLMLDVTDIVKNTDLINFKDQEVTLFGFGSQEDSFISAEELAVLSQTITWEVLTSVGERVPRVYVSSKKSLLGKDGGGL